MFVFVRKMIALLSRRERKQLYWLLVAMIVMAVVEVSSVGSIMPFMTVISNPDVIMTHKWLGLLYKTFHFESSKTFLLALGVSVFVILIISNTCTAIITWMIFHFTWLRNHSISKRLFSKYLTEPYVFFLNRNTADLEKNILNEVQLVAIGILNSLLMIIKSGVTILLLFSLLVVIDPILAIIVSVLLGTAYFILFGFSSKKLRRIGCERAEANTKRFQMVNEALSGIKVLRVLRREGYFLDEFSKYSFIVSYNFVKKSVIAQLPRYGFEIIAFGGVLLIILYFLATEGGLDKIVPILSLYAFAGYRMMPAMQTVFNKAANIRYIIPSLDILYTDLCSNDTAEMADEVGEHIYEPICLKQGIHLKNIAFSYPGQMKPVFENLDVYIPVKKTIGLAGTTGSGKTTIIDILLGLLKPENGELLVDNIKIDVTNMSGWQSIIGYVPQDIFLTDESVMGNIALGVPQTKINRDSIVRASKLANLHEFIMNELPNEYETLVGERGIRISGGQRQRIGIARALYHDPEVLIFDEATSSLDGVTEKKIMQEINNLSQKKTIIMIAHRLTTLQECDEIFLIDKGKIIDKGKYHQLSKTNEYFKDIKNV